MSYLYETHLHTWPASACGRSAGSDYVARYQDAGYDGMFVTDHFFRGNCGVDRSLPWREFVHRFCAGYESALNEGLRRGFPVFFGWEESYEGDDFLIYGLDKAWLLEHPEVVTWDRRTQFEEVRRAGGCVVQAHPFRAASYIRDIHLSPWHADAVEGMNGGNRPAWNALGLRYARLTGLPVTAGSDMHCVDDVRPERLAGVRLEAPLTSAKDYVDIIINRAPVEAVFGGELPDWSPDLEPELPVVWHGPGGQSFAYDPVRALREGLPTPPD